MKHYPAVIVLLLLTLSSALASIGSYEATDRAVATDLSRALAETLREKQSDVVSADTIRTFNGHLQIAQLRGCAVIAVGTHRGRLQLEARCPATTVWRLSDQRPAAILALMALLWAPACVGKRRQPKPVVAGVTLGTLTLSDTDQQFYTPSGLAVRLTPMQHQLLTLFFRSGSQQLSKQAICDALWPKKPDASETLYTLVRRLKPIIAPYGLRLEADRGRAYRLVSC